MYVFDRRCLFCFCFVLVPRFVSFGLQFIYIRLVGRNSERCVVATWIEPREESLVENSR